MSKLILSFHSFALPLHTDMETKIESTNQGGKVLAYDGDQLVGQLDFAFDGRLSCQREQSQDGLSFAESSRQCSTKWNNVLRIEHTRAFVEGLGVGALLVNAANDYAINHSLKVLPVCSFAYAWYQRHPQFKDILDEHTGEGVSFGI